MRAFSVAIRLSIRSFVACAAARRASSVSLLQADSAVISASLSSSRRWRCFSSDSAS
jgi:hypothetical protein